MIGALLGLWLGIGSALAQTEPVPPAMVAVVEAVDLGNGGDPKGAVRALDKVLKDQPGNVDATVARGVFRYLSGDEAGAREDLGKAFDVRLWEHRKVESKTGTDVSMTQTTLDLTELKELGVSIITVLAARAGELERARALVKRAGETFDPNPRLIAATARVELAEGEPGAAWASLAAALKQPDATRFVQSVASEMVAMDPQGAPPAVTAWLKAAGQWTAHYNAAVGALRSRDYPSCVTEAAEGLAAFPDHPKMLSVGYPCAARVDLPRAEVWLKALGGPKRAEPWSVLAHGRTLQKQNRPDEALALLEKMPSGLPEKLAGQVETTQLEILLDAGDLDRAQREAKGHAPVAELNVAHALVGAGRPDDAERLLKLVCPRLEGQAAHGNCTQLAEYVQSLK